MGFREHFPIPAAVLYCTIDLRSHPSFCELPGYKRTLTMFLTSIHVLWPVARSRVLVIQQPSDAKLLGGRSIPTGPVSRAAGLVAEDTVQPVTVLPRNGSV